jgi:hypothetical protein
MKRLFIVLLFLLLTTFILPKQTTFAAESAAWRFSSYSKEYDAADAGEVNAAAYVDRTNSGNMVSISCMIMPAPRICTDDPIKYLMLLKGSAIGKTSDVIAATFSTPPASTYAFVQDMGQTLGFLPKQTYAATGVGFNGMQALLPLWKVFRDIAYLFLAVVMIIIGFMVMLRKKIDPKTVVTVQNALPRIVITLLLITFSYAIVGVMIDLMYVAILIAVSVFSSTGLLPPPDWLNQLAIPTKEQLYTQGSLLQNLANIKVSPLQILGIKWSGIEGALVSVGIVGGGALAIIGGALLTPIIAPVGIGLTAAGGIVSIGLPLLYLIMSLLMIFLFIRLTILFASAYIQIVIALIFGPIQILFEAFPGSTSFASWFKNLIANISVFPVAAVMFMLANVFAEFANKENVNIWLPPYTGLFSNTTAMSALISLGLLFTIPSIAGSIKEALKAKPAVNAGPSAIFGPVGSAGGQGFQLLYQGAMIRSFWSHGSPPGTTVLQRQMGQKKDGPH